MKTYIYICLLTIIGYQAQAQTYNYTDLGVLFSQDNHIGTARYTGLNGAMGAVGGDLSSININPAGIAVYNHGEINLTLGSSNFSNNTSYYNNTINNQSNAFNTDQVGTVFVFQDAITTNSWSKISFAINYQKTADFHTRNSFFGNSGFASFITHPNDPDTDNTYENAISQDFYNYIDGKSSKVNLALAGQYGKNFYAGVSLNFHHLDFSQTTTLNELSSDDDDRILDVLATESIHENASGFSVNLGFIYKPIQSIRLGASYQSPTWYNMEEEYNIRELIASIPPNINAANPYTNNSYLNYDYNSASKLTLSGAVVISKQGFINIDYTYKNYNTLSTTPPDNLTSLNYADYQEINEGFRNDNQYFTDVLQNTHNVNIGGEYRYKNISLRGGLGYQQSPFKDHLDPRATDILKLGDLYSGSLGAGVRFGASKLDIAYRKTTQDNEYDFNDANQEFEYIESGMVNNDNSRIVATYTYSF